MIVIKELLHAVGAEVRGIEIAGLEVGDILYTTDHAEELARALDVSRTLLNRMLETHYSDGLEDASDLVKCFLDSGHVLTNYREATK